VFYRLKLRLSLFKILELAKQLNNLTLRAITGIFIIIVVIAATVVSKYSYGILFLLLTVVASREYIKITGLDQISQMKKWILVLANVTVFLLGYFIAIDWLPDNLRIFGILPVFFLYSAGLFGRTTPNFRLSSLLISGHVYIGIPLMLLSYIYLHKQQFWPSYVIAILVFVWSNDIGGYLLGKFFGKTKMLPAVSPNKTWEGFFGGVILSLISGYVFSFFSDNIEPVEWILFGFVVSLGTSFGDLVASSLKRSFGFKDSGIFFPGHGGMIDRFDGFFIAIVVAFVYLNILGVIR